MPLQAFQGLAASFHIACGDPQSISSNSGSAYLLKRLPLESSERARNLLI